MRGIIGVEAMVRHGKKLSEGKEKEGEGRCISPVQPDPFSLGLWYNFRGGRGGDYVYLCTRSFPTPVSKQTLKIKSTRLKGMVNAKKSLI